MSIKWFLFVTRGFFFVFVKEQNIILQSLKKVVLHFIHFIQCSRFFFCCFSFQLVKAYDESARWLSTGLGRAMLAEFNPCQALRQRVTHVLVALGEKLLLFICAGQRVAAVVGAHVKGGIHWVGEVGGLVWVQSKV